MSNAEKDIDSVFFIKIFLVYLCITAVTLLCLLLFFKNFSWVDLSPQAITDIPESLMLYDKNDELAAAANGGQNRIFIKLDDLPEHVKMAFVAAEDARFYEHNGIDIKRIFGAALSDIRAGYFKEGGSTITQQLIKNSHLTGTKKLSRKLQEALLACQLESRYTKDEILEMYLNYIYFGNGAYGIEAAAQTYFSKSASELSVAQAAALAGVIKSPANYSPSAEPENCLARRNHVLELMYKYGFIDFEAYDSASKEALAVTDAPALNCDYGFFTDEVLKSASEILNISIDRLLTGGYGIYTSLDISVAEKTQELLNNNELFPGDGVQCAVIVMETQTGAISCIFGGRQYETRMGFNRATMAMRSPGSTIKPLLVYAPALESRIITAATVLKDEKKVFNGYSPNNFKDRYYGNVTVRDALVKSLNVPAVEIFERMGIERGKRFAQEAGIVFDRFDNNLSLALGGFTKGVSPLMLASAYQCLGNGGVKNEAYYINRITDSEGRTVYSRPQSDGKRVFSAETAYIIGDILKDAANKYGSPFAKLKKQNISAKTGTASYRDKGNSDIWVASYNCEYTVVVWQGYDNTDPEHCLASSATGSKYPSVIAASIFDSIYADGRAEPFAQRPAGIKEITLDKDALYDGSSELATELTPDKSRISELFIAGTEPTEYSSYYSVPKACEINAAVSGGTVTVSIVPRNSYTLYRIYRITDNEHLQIAALSGRAGETLSIEDGSAHGTVSYYAIPEHKELKNNDGSPLLGKASRLISVTVESTDYYPNTA